MVSATTCEAYLYYENTLTWLLDLELEGLRGEFKITSSLQIKQR